MVVTAIAGAIVLGVLAASGCCWALATLKLSAGLPLVPWRPRRAAPWAVADLVGAVALYLVAMLLMGSALRQAGYLPEVLDEAKLTLDQRQVLVWANIGGSVLLLVLGLPLIAWRSRATLRDFGWSPETLLADVRLGAIGFCMLAPPVYAVQAILTQFWPSKHPLMEMFRSTPDPWFFGVLVLAAVIVAPIFEELVFRVLVQGFLEKLCTFRGTAAELLLGVPAADSLSGQPLSPHPADPNEDVSPVLIADLAPHSAKPVVDDLQPPLVSWLAWIPIALSSAIFALLHLSHGPDWIPLVFLAAGMGYLYQRTHSLVPSVVVHLLLNGLSMMGLWVQVYEMPDKV
jgi:membrane protease YdiL (CAAX protease family)